MNYITVLQQDFSLDIYFFQQKSFKTTVLPYLFKTAIAELAISSACAVIALPFTVVPFTGFLFVRTTAIVITNIVLRLLSITLASLSLGFKEMQHNTSEKVTKYFSYFSETWASTVFSALGASPLTVLLHECGHALAGKTLFQLISTPTIKMNASWLTVSGSTLISYKNFTRIGSWLGLQKCLTIISASGATMSVFLGTIQIGIANSLKEKYSIVANYLKVVGVTIIAIEILYASQVLWKSSFSKGHDFFYLSQHGVHPLVAITVMIAIPAIVQGAFYLYNRLQAKKQNELEVTI